MVYRFVIISDEVEGFRRDIRVGSGATFEMFAHAILDSVGYTKDEVTTFILCDDRWRKTGEVSMVDMGYGTEHDVYLMHNTALDEFLTEEKQKLMFTFDLLNDRSFYIELREITYGENLSAAEVVRSKGNAPKQTIDPEPIVTPKPHTHSAPAAPSGEMTTAELLGSLLLNDDYTRRTGADEDDDVDEFEGDLNYDDDDELLEQGLEIEDDLPEGGTGR